MTTGRRRHLFHALVAASLLLLVTQLRSVAPDGALTWTGFVWHAIDANGERLEKKTFLPLDYRNGQIYLPLSVDGETRSDYFFDTGASLFPLVTDQEEWIRLTGRQASDPRNRRYTLPSLNDKWLETIGAPMTGRLKIGPVSAKSPMVFFINDPMFRVDRMPNTRGIVGNALFVREYAVVIDLPGRRIGFLRSTDLARN